MALSYLSAFTFIASTGWGADLKLSGGRRSAQIVAFNCRLGHIGGLPVEAAEFGMDAGVAQG
jgi:hypothetical protein